MLQSFNEEYADGDNLGALDCGHDFHTNCIKQWLMLKNLCPICKTTALRTKWISENRFQLGPSLSGGLTHHSNASGAA
ncbi:e3 ubiquitin-protein ligase mbr2 [Quercus suber]|uniref:RING-type E3 ubiquitin transferase n=1 Tax=Quercus suber TaxID=58331 RepID=A0AAW0KAG7_QUESU